jgi:DNA-binding MarR family transcriptional regulator
MELNEKVMIFIVMASELFKKQSSAILKQHGLTFSHYNVLKHLVVSGHGRDTVSNISKKMLVTAPNMSGMAKRMEKAGLIERKEDAKDERLVMLQITTKGLEILSSIREIQEQHGGAYLEAYSQEQKKEVLSVLRNIVKRGKHLSDSVS